jgi:predicted ribonuclease YlaK
MDMAKATGGAPAMRTTIVFDTSVLFINPNPSEIPELPKAANLDCLIPATVVWELGLLIQRVGTRDKARAAMNVMKSFAERGAANKPISCGKTLTLRIGRSDEVVMDPPLDVNVADDRILGSAMYEARKGKPVILLTTDLSMHIKALSLGLDSLYIDRPQDIHAILSAREQRSLGFIGLA